MSDSHVADAKVLEPITYLSQIPGKNLRSALIECFQIWYQIDEPKLQSIKEIISSLHEASLLIDDIEDNSKVVEYADSSFNIWSAKHY